jgi:hypothetical protein
MCAVCFVVCPQPPMRREGKKQNDGIYSIVCDFLCAAVVFVFFISY